MAIIGKDIEKAKRFLEKGELVAVPTETVYGLAGNALDASVVAKIFSVKDRPAFDPIIVHVSSFEEAGKYWVAVPNQAVQLARHFWPGPLTLLLNKKDTIPDLVTAGLDRVGIRCPHHEMTGKLLSKITFPLAAPSANPFGYVSPTTAQHVQDQLGEKVSYILDGGPCQVGIESTIVGWEGDEATVYRMGGISIEQIESVIGKVKVLVHSSSQPQSPGQLKSHYAPGKKFFLGNIQALIRKHQPVKPGILTFKTKVAGVQADSQYVLSSTGDLNEAARNLFLMLRELDASQVDMVFAEEVPDEGLGRAINDRLRRAAAL